TSRRGRCVRACPIAPTIPPSTEGFSWLTRAPPSLPLFPYTTLFRSTRRSSSRASSRTRIRPSWGARRSAISSSARSLTREMTARSEEHTSELQSLRHLVCRLLLEKKKELKTNLNQQRDHAALHDDER